MTEGDTAVSTRTSIYQVPGSRVYMNGGLFCMYVQQCRCGRGNYNGNRHYSARLGYFSTNYCLCVQVDTQAQPGNRHYVLCWKLRIISRVVVRQVPIISSTYICTLPALKNDRTEYTSARLHSSPYQVAAAVPWGPSSGANTSRVWDVEQHRGTYYEYFVPLL